MSWTFIIKNWRVEVDWEGLTVSPLDELDTNARCKPGSAPEHEPNFEAHEREQQVWA